MTGRLNVGLRQLFAGPNDGKIQYSNDEIKIFAATYKIGMTVIVFGVAGELTIAVWAWGVRGPTISFYAFVGVDLLVAGAAAAAGALFGFVFGIPRSLEPASRAAAVVAVTQSNDQAASRAAMGVNTNLERISDWLTTLLIGATLVQIKDIASWVGNLGKNLLVVGQPANDAVVPIIVIYFFALSFLGVYLITRLYLTSALGLLGLYPGPTVAAAPALPALKQQMKKAVSSGDADDMKAAIDNLDGANLKPAEADDVELNADLARILTKQMRAGAATDRAPLLKAALAKAGVDGPTKTTLKAEFDAGPMKSGDATLDGDIAKLLS